MSKSLLLLLLAAVPALAQETEEPRRALESAGEREAPDPHELLAAALLGYRKQGDRVVAVKVEQKQPQEQPQAPGAGGNGVVFQVVVQGPGGPAEDPYEGEAEAWRDAEGTTVIVSRKEVPGFGLYITPERTIRRVTAEGKGPGTDQLRAELTSLMDGERFFKHAMVAKLEQRVDEKTGESVWSGTVDKEIVRPVRVAGENPQVAQIVAGMRPRVLKARLELRVTKEGRLARASVTIVRNDPTREMMRDANFGGIIVKGAGIPQKQEKKPDADGEKHDIEGVSTVYTLDFTKKQPSERAIAFKREISRALRDAK